MANPTTNFGWVMPTSTDLVTDLPADFNVFGQGVDTTMQYLKGGTTGQVLSKTSATDMAFTWVTTDDVNAIQNDIVDAKGDLIAASAADTPARLAVGTAGQILSVDSSTTTGLKWVTPNPGDITAVNVTSPITGGGTSGDVTISIQDALTTQKGAVQLSDSTSTTSSILAATPTAVKAAYDKASTAATTSIAGIVQLSDSTSTTSSVLASTPTATKSAYDLANGAIAKTTVTTAGDIIYRNATVPTRLGIGTAGQVLAVNSGATAPEWTTASGGGLVKVVSASFTASAGLSVNGCFTSTYKNYKIIFRVKASTAAGTIGWRWRASGTDQASGYYYGWNLTNNSGATTLVTANNSSSIDLGGITEVGYFNNYSYDIFGPQANTQVASFYGGGTFTNAGQRGFGGGLYAAVVAYDGFSLVTSQNITGEYTVYGYAN